MMQLAQITQAVHGQLLGADVPLTGITTDSRRSCHGELFVALKGERFDAHDFIKDAQHAGAAAVLVERDVECELPKVLVADSHQALIDMATWWRAQFVIPVIGVTGSVGKTTVKEMLGCIFAERGKGLVTKGNLNNEIGVPLTLLRLVANDQYAVVELGMNHAGEIARLTQIARPTIAMINNAAAAHLESLGTIEAVARAKGEIFAGLSDDGIAVINADDKYADLWRDLIGKHPIVTFGFSADAQITASYELGSRGLEMKVTTPTKKFSVKLATLGKHNVSNALAAIAVARAANIPTKLIQSGLAKYRPIGGRLNVITVAGVTLIDDTYNANPASMCAAIEVLAQYDNSILIVGDMGELGAAAMSAHEELGEIATTNKIKHLYACGQFANAVVKKFKGRSVSSFANQVELINALTPSHLLQQTGLTDSPDTRIAILVKGSRFMRMENVVQHLNLLLERIGSVQLSNGGQSC